MINVKNRKIKYCITLFIFVMVFFTPDIRFGIKPSWLLALLGFFTLLDKSFVKEFKINFMGNIKFWILFVFSVIYLSMQPLIHMTGDLSYIKMLIGTTLTLFRGLLLIYILFKYYKDDILKRYCLFFIDACCIYVAFTIAFIIFPEFKEFWLNTILISYTKVTYAAYQYRYSLSGFAAFASSSTFALAAVISGYLISNSQRVKLLQIIKFILIIVGCFFYGRIAFIGIVLGCLLIVFVNNNATKLLKVMAIVAIAVGTLLVLLNYLGTVNNSFIIWKNWAFAFIKQLFVEHEITDYSFTHMFQDMYFLPEFKTFVLGDGYYTETATGLYYMHTDVGYMRLLLYAGVIGEIITFLPVLYLLRQTYFMASRKTDRYMILAIMMLWLVLEAKGDSYHRIMMLVYPMFLVIYSERAVN